MVELYHLSFKARDRRLDKVFFTSAMPGLCVKTATPPQLLCDLSPGKGIWRLCGATLDYEMFGMLRYLGMFGRSRKTPLIQDMVKIDRLYFETSEILAPSHWH